MTQKETRGGNPHPFAVAIAWLRALRGWDQTELAAAAGMLASAISRYERGKRSPTRKTLDRLAAAAGLPGPAVDRLLGWIRLAQAALGTMPNESTCADQEAAMEKLTQGRAGFVGSATALILADLSLNEDRQRRLAAPVAADRQQAPELWARLARRTNAQRVLLVEESAEFRSWALCELVCEESVKAAAESAGRAVELAQLALAIAERAPGEESWRCGLQSRC